MEIKVEASTEQTFSKVELYVDNSKVKERTDQNFTETLTIANGSHRIRARVLDSQGASADHEIGVGINEPYASPTPTP